MGEKCRTVEDLIEAVSRCPSINKQGLLEACKSLVYWTLFCEILKETDNRLSRGTYDIERIVYDILQEWFGDNIDEWPVDLEIIRERVKISLAGRINERGNKERKAKEWLLKINPVCQWKLSKCTETKNLELDHKWPRSLGGTSDRENVQLLCRYHNSLKGTLPIWGEIKWW